MSGPVSVHELESQVLSLVKKISFTEVAVDQPLLSSQVLDSIAVVDLVVEIEQSFGVSFDLQHINEAEFNTVRQIAEKIAKAKSV